jgi:hypothetical protein
MAVAATLWFFRAEKINHDWPFDLNMVDQSCCCAGNRNRRLTFGGSSFVQNAEVGEFQLSDLAYWRQLKKSWGLLAGLISHSANLTARSRSLSARMNVLEVW